MVFLSRKTTEKKAQENQELGIEQVIKGINFVRAKFHVRHAEDS